jgi:hypothetical protein
LDINPKNNHFIHRYQASRKKIVGKEINILSDPRICFIISHIYFGNSKSYLEHFVDNIFNFYPDSKVILVDNGSTDFSTIESTKNKFSQIVILENYTNHKFELGAYKRGFDYLMDEDLINTFDYYVCTQDTYILKNRYDFRELVGAKYSPYNQQVYACPISWGFGYQDFSTHTPPWLSLLNLLGEFENNYNPLNTYSDFDWGYKTKKALHCYCTCFVVHKSRTSALYNYLKRLYINTRFQSECGERFMAHVLLKLNGGINYQIDKNPYILYDQWKTNLEENFEHGYFAKQQQGKR